MESKFLATWSKNYTGQFRVYGYGRPNVISDGKIFPLDHNKGTNKDNRYQQN